MFDAKQLRADFPVLVNNPDLVYLDSAATSLKPTPVLAAVAEYYEQYTANIKRGIYKASMKATEEYERSRDAVCQLIGASRDEIIFTRNTTEGLNLVMYALGTNIIEPGDEIVTTIMEHHSNFVPWQQLAIQNGADLKIMGITSTGGLDIYDSHSGGVTLGGIVTKKTKILALTHVSNVLGTINPIKDIIASARRINPAIVVVVDGAQAVQHLSVDVRDLDCDFYAFSSHKMYGPTGVGVLYGKKARLEAMPPFQYGGEMIQEVHLDHTLFAELPEKFEAGTPAIAEIIGLRHAVEYLRSLASQDAELHTKRLLSQLHEQITALSTDRLTVLSNTNLEENVGVFTFSIEGAHPHDIASILDESNISVRAGHHCAMPLHNQLNKAASTRVSLGVYNTVSDIEAFINGLQKVLNIFS
ncbi:SufS family cysteine desulfurase [Candidatus Microgenomates bacterium]|nr:SufS family cysteine desulfurase [Candidatus Microgenomates bacterium]